MPLHRRAASPLAPCRAPASCPPFRSAHHTALPQALQVVEYLLRRGSPACLQAAGELLVPLAALANFAYLDPKDGRDCGVNVRLRAAAVKVRRGALAAAIKGPGRADGLGGF